MGLENRDYFRDASREDGGIGGAGSSWPPVCKWILIITIGVFLLQIFWTKPASIDSIRETHIELPAGEEPTEEELLAMLEWLPSTSVVETWFQMDTDKVLRGQIWRLITSAFCHDRFSLFHIIFNMLFLIWFGRTLERMYGSREFLLFYLSAAMVASLAYLVLDLFTGDRFPAIGASGAVMGVVMLYAMHFPREEIRLWFFWPIQVRWIVLFYVVFDLHPVLLTLAGDNFNDGVAHAAHLGGLAFGFAYYKFGWRLEKPFGFVKIRFHTDSTPSPKRKPPPKKRKKPVPKPPSSSHPDAAKIDAILDKISREGINSLTPQERSFLEKSSEQARRRKPRD